MCVCVCLCARLQHTGDVLDCPNDCGTSRPPVGTDRLVVSQRLLTDAISSLVDSTRGADGAAVATRELRCAAGRTVNEDIRIPGSPALWVCFSPDSTLRVTQPPARRGSDDDEPALVASDQKLTLRSTGGVVAYTVQTFRGDSESLKPVLVPGSAVQFTLKCVQACTIKVAVRPLHGMWLGVRLSMRV